MQMVAWMWMTIHRQLGRLLSYYILIIYFLIVFHYHLELFCYHPITAQTPISQMSHLNLPLPSSFLPFLIPLLLWQLKLQYPKYPISISPFLPPSFPSSLPLLLWQLKPQCPKHGGDSKVICFQGVWECLEWSRQSPGPSWKLVMVPGIHHSRYFFETLPLLSPTAKYWTNYVRCGPIISSNGPRGHFGCGRLFKTRVKCKIHLFSWHGAIALYCLLVLPTVVALPIVLPASWPYSTSRSFAEAQPADFLGSTTRRPFAYIYLYMYICGSCLCILSAGGKKKQKKAPLAPSDMNNAEWRWVVKWLPA